MAEKILLVLPEAFNCAGGIQMFNRALCLAAGNRALHIGHSVDALVLNDNSPDVNYINEGFSSFAGMGKSKTKFILKYIQKILSSTYDWIIFGHISLSPLALITKQFSSTPKLGVITHGIEVWQPLSTLQRQSLRYVDLILAVSEYTKNEIVKHNDIPAGKIKIFPNTLDPYWKSSLLIKDVCGLPFILSVTRMNKEDRYKGIDNVIRSLPAVVERIGPVVYRVVGQGTDVPRLQALASALGVERYVTFLGGIAEATLREQYQSCSLFVLPSRKEGFGIVFLEAMAYGKAVVGGAHGGTPSVVKDGETGFLVDNSDVDGIADAIVRLLNDDKMRNSFGQAGYQRLINEFTFKKFEQNFREVFQSFA